MTADNMAARTRSRKVLSLGLFCSVFLCPALDVPGEDAFVSVAREDVRDAMRDWGDYDPTATTNGARFQATVLLRLARNAAAEKPDGPPLRIGPVEWFDAFLETIQKDSVDAPQFSKLSRHYGQNTEVEYRRDRVIRRVKAGPEPALAANVTIWWPDGPGAAASYSYEDTLSSPDLKVTNHRVITYRLVDYGDIVMFDEIEGVTGRPTSGVLALLFKLIGEGRIVHSRSSRAEDGLMVTRARSKKGFFSVNPTVTTWPDGRTEDGILDGRDDMEAIVANLKREKEIDYVELAADR